MSQFTSKRLLELASLIACDADRDEEDAANALRAYAATLRQQAEQAGGVVSEDSVSMAYDAFLRLIGPDVHFALSRVPPIKARQAMRAALEAVWKDIRNA